MVDFSKTGYTVIQDWLTDAELTEFLDDYNNSTGLLIHDLNHVPFTAKLDETVEFVRAAFDTVSPHYRNTIIEICR